MSDSVQFSSVRRGYHQGEVHGYLERLNEELQVTATDRDAAAAQARALAKQLEASRAQLEELRSEVDRLAVAPTTAQGMSDRISRMLRLAEDEAADIRETAQSNAAEMIALAEQNADQVRRNAHELAIETEQRLAAARTEADDIIAAARADAARLAAEAEHQRKAEQHDFETTMRGRRSKLVAEIDELDRTAKAKAEEKLTNARETAESLRSVRANILSQLMGIREQLDEVPDLLSAVENEKLID